MGINPELWAQDPEPSSAFAGKNAELYVVKALEYGLNSAREMDDLIAREALLIAQRRDAAAGVEIERAVTALEALLDQDDVREELFSKLGSVSLERQFND